MTVNSKNLYKLKNYKMPFSNIIKIQGFEHYALNELIKIYEENDIIHGYKNVPTIWYFDEDNNKHCHYIDFYIKNINKFIEIKSE